MNPLLTDIFSAVYIVNLPERSDRRSEMEAELKKVNLSYQEKKIVVFPAIKPADQGKFPGIGARGCFLSHLEILKKAREDQADSVLIMEDDLAISPKLQPFLPLIKDKLSQENWSLLYLGHVVPVESGNNLNLVNYNQPLLTTHFYAVNGKILDRLVDFLETVKERPAGHPLGGPMHYDGALNTFRQQNPDIITLLSVPNLGSQRSSRSDVASARWFDKAPGISFIVAELRKIINTPEKIIAISKREQLKNDNTYNNYRLKDRIINLNLS